VPPRQLRVRSRRFLGGVRDLAHLPGEDRVPKGAQGSERHLVADANPEIRRGLGAEARGLGVEMRPPRVPDVLSQDRPGRGIGEGIGMVQRVKVEIRHREPLLAELRREDEHGVRGARPVLGEVDAREPSAARQLPVGRRRVHLPVRGAQQGVVEEGEGDGRVRREWLGGARRGAVQDRRRERQRDSDVDRARPHSISPPAAVRRTP
jgi:hypothetical protein